MHHSLLSKVLCYTLSFALVFNSFFVSLAEANNTTGEGQDFEQFGVDYSASLRRRLKAPDGKPRYVRRMPTQNNECGFYGLLADRVDENPRHAATAKLLSLFEKPDQSETIRLLVPELKELIVAGELNPLKNSGFKTTPQHLYEKIWAIESKKDAKVQKVNKALGVSGRTLAQLLGMDPNHNNPVIDPLRKIAKKLEDVNDVIHEWANDLSNLKIYVKEWLGKPGVMLGYLIGEGAGTSAMDAIAKAYGLNVVVYQEDGTGKLRENHRFESAPSAETIELLHTSTPESKTLNHFDRLETDVYRNFERVHLGFSPLLRNKVSLAFEVWPMLRLTPTREGVYAIPIEKYLEKESAEIFFSAQGKIIGTLKKYDAHVLFKGSQGKDFEFTSTQPLQSLNISTDGWVKLSKNWDVKSVLAVVCKKLSLWNPDNKNNLSKVEVDETIALDVEGDVENCAHLLAKKRLNLKYKSFENKGLLETPEVCLSEGDVFKNFPKSCLKVGHYYRAKVTKYTDHGSNRWTGHSELDLGQLWGEQGCDTELKSAIFRVEGALEYCGNFRVHHFLGLKTKGFLKFSGQLLSNKTLPEGITTSALPTDIQAVIKAMPHQVYLEGEKGTRVSQYGDVKVNSGSVAFSSQNGSFVLEGKSQSGYGANNDTRVNAKRASVSGELTSFQKLFMHLDETVHLAGIVKANELLLKARDYASSKTYEGTFEKAFIDVDRFTHAGTHEAASTVVLAQQSIRNNGRLGSDYLKMTSPLVYNGFGATLDSQQLELKAGILWNNGGIFSNQSSGSSLVGFHGVCLPNLTRGHVLTSQNALNASRVALGYVSPGLSTAVTLFNLAFSVPSLYRSTKAIYDRASSGEVTRNTDWIELLVDAKTTAIHLAYTGLGLYNNGSALRDTLYPRKTPEASSETPPPLSESKEETLQEASEAASENTTTTPSPQPSATDQKSTDLLSSVPWAEVAKDVVFSFGPSLENSSLIDLGGLAVSGFVNNYSLIKLGGIRVGGTVNDYAFWDIDPIYYLNQWGVTGHLNGLMPSGTSLYNPFRGQVADRSNAYSYYRADQGWDASRSRNVYTLHGTENGMHLGTQVNVKSDRTLTVGDDFTFKGAYARFEGKNSLDISGKHLGNHVDVKSDNLIVGDKFVFEGTNASLEGKDKLDISGTHLGSNVTVKSDNLTVGEKFTFKGTHLSFDGKDKLDLSEAAHIKAELLSLKGPNIDAEALARRNGSGSGLDVQTLLHVESNISFKPQSPLTMVAGLSLRVPQVTVDHALHSQQGYFELASTDTNTEIAINAPITAGGSKSYSYWEKNPETQELTLKEGRYGVKLDSAQDLEVKGVKIHSQNGDILAFAKGKVDLGHTDVQIGSNNLYEINYVTVKEDWAKFDITTLEATNGRNIIKAGGDVTFDVSQLVSTFGAEVISGGKIIFKDLTTSGNIWWDTSRINIYSKLYKKTWAWIDGAYPDYRPSAISVIHQPKVLTDQNDIYLQAEDGVENYGGIIKAPRFVSIYTDGKFENRNGGYVKGGVLTQAYAKLGILNECGEDFSQRGSARYRESFIGGGTGLEMELENPETKSSEIKRVGLSLKTDGEFINIASQVHAPGTVLVKAKEGIKNLSRYYIDHWEENYKKGHKFNRKSYHVDHYGPVIAQASMRSDEGALYLCGYKKFYSTSTQLNSHEGVKFFMDPEAQFDILDTVATSQTITTKKSSSLGITYATGRTSETHQVSFPSVVSQEIGETVIWAPEGTVHSRGTQFILPGEFRAYGKTGDFSNSFLNNELITTTHSWVPRVTPDAIEIGQRQQTTHQTSTSISDGFMYSDQAAFYFTESLKFGVGGVPHVTTKLSLHTPDMTVEGAPLSSTYKFHEQQVGLGLGTDLTPFMTYSERFQKQQKVSWLSNHLTAPEVEFDVGTLHLKAAGISANKMTGTIGKVDLDSQVSTSASHSKEVSLSKTAVSVSQQKSSEAAVVDSFMRTQDASGLTIGELEASGRSEANFQDVQGAVQGSTTFTPMQDSRKSHGYSVSKDLSSSSSSLGALSGVSGSINNGSTRFPFKMDYLDPAFRERLHQSFADIASLAHNPSLWSQAIPAVQTLLQETSFVAHGTGNARLASRLDGLNHTLALGSSSPQEWTNPSSLYHALAEAEGALRSFGVQGRGLDSLATVRETLGAVAFSQNAHEIYQMQKELERLQENQGERIPLANIPEDQGALAEEDLPDLIEEMLPDLTEEGNSRIPGNYTPWILPADSYCPVQDWDALLSSYPSQGSSRIIQDGILNLYENQIALAAQHPLLTDFYHRFLDGFGLTVQGLEYGHAARIGYGVCAALSLPAGGGALAVPAGTTCALLSMYGLSKFNAFFGENMPVLVDNLSQETASIACDRENQNECKTALVSLSSSGIDIASVASSLRVPSSYKMSTEHGSSPFSSGPSLFSTPEMPHSFTNIGVLQPTHTFFPEKAYRDFFTSLSSPSHSKLSGAQSYKLSWPGPSASSWGSLDQEGKLHIYKYNTKPNIRTADAFRLDLPKKETPAKQWAQNSEKLRQYMRTQQPVYDAYRDPFSGRQVDAGTGSYLNAERKLLESKEWLYDPDVGAYYLPISYAGALFLKGNTSKIIPFASRKPLKSGDIPK